MIGADVLGANICKGLGNGGEEKRIGRALLYEWKNRPTLWSEAKGVVDGLT